MDIKKNIEFLEAMCDAADAAAKDGDLSLANRMAANPAFGHYYVNVRRLRALTPERWAQDYSPQMQAVDRVRENAEIAEAQSAQSKERVTTLEQQIAELTTMVKALLEVQTAKQRAAVVEALSDDESKDEDQAEPEEPADNPSEGDADAGDTTDEEEVDDEKKENEAE